MKPSLTTRRPVITALALLCGFPMGWLTVRLIRGISAEKKPVIVISSSFPVPATPPPPPPSSSSAGGFLRQLYQDIAAGKTLDWKSVLETAHSSGDIPLCAILVAFWADKDPFAARSWAEQKERYIHFYTPITEAIADTWARRDPIAAMQGFVDTDYEVPLPLWRIFDIAAAQDMETAKLLVARFPGYFNDMSSTTPRDFSQAAEAMSVMPPGVDRAKCIISVVRVWMDDGTPAAMTWWHSEAAAPLRAELANNPSLLLGEGSFLLRELSPSELQTAKSGVTSNPDSQRAFHQREAENLLFTDPAAAAALATETLTGEARSIIFQKAVAALQKSDPAAARQIILSMPSGSERDALLESVAE